MIRSAGMHKTPPSQDVADLLASFAPEVRSASRRLRAAGQRIPRRDRRPGHLPRYAVAPILGDG
jgi:hypothetical protein